MKNKFQGFLCWLGLHDWSKWKVTTMSDVVSWQTKVCKSCGFVEQIYL